MKKKNTGKEFEYLTESIFRKLIKNPDIETVEQNVMIDGIDGKRQIDVLIKSEVAGITIITVIECKDYNSKISVGKIDEFHSKLLDINANKGILVSKKGFSSTAVKKAKRLGITICTAHEVMKPSWSIDFDIPLIIDLWQPINQDIRYKIHISEAGDTVKNPYIVNDINIFDEIHKDWSQKKINVKKRKGLQKINLERLKPPFFTRLANKNNAKRRITDLNIYLEVTNECYFIPLSQVKNTKILNNLSDKKVTVFSDINSIFDLSDKFISIPCESNLNKIGVKLCLLITPLLEKTKPNSA